MAINPMTLLHMKERFNLFNQDHPRIMPFVNAVGSQALKEGSVLELKVTTPEGKEYITNLKLNANDLETIDMLRKQQ